MKSHKLALVSAGRSPERQALADALAAKAETDKVVSAVRGIAERARGALVAAQQRHSTAESTLAEARERAIGAVTASDGVQPPELKHLRRDVADAADDIDIASAALSRAEAEIGNQDYADRKSRETVEVAVEAVLAAGFDAAYEAALDAARKMARLAWIAEKLGSASNPYDGTAHRRATSAQCLNPHMAVPNREVSSTQDAARAEVSSARVALMTDPDAPLPELA